MLTDISEGSICFHYLLYLRILVTWYGVDFALPTSEILLILIY